MAGDWIKMRGNLWDDPRVSRLVDLTDSSEAAVVGALYWLWASADQHSEDGVLTGLSTRSIDRKVGVKGFAEALITVGWITESDIGIHITRFEEHNGTSAKRRISESRRKMSARDADKLQTDCGQDEEDQRNFCAPREEREKRREELNLPLEKRVEENKEKPRRGSRLPSGWIADESDKHFCETERPDLDLEAMQAKFRDYWHGVAGSKGCKLDWSATWRNFIRSERRAPQSFKPFESERDRKRREVVEVLTGKKNDYANIIDI